MVVLGVATLLSYRLDINYIETLCMTSYVGRLRDQVHLLKGACVQDGGHNWLIVDDLVDSGATLLCVKDLLPKAFVATLYVKSLDFPRPDAFVRIFNTPHWIVFPWNV